MKAKTALYTLLLLLTAVQVQAVEFFSRKLNTTNGLPDNNVRNLAQDSKGFIWMGTPNGLYRFDGYFYTVYRHTGTGDEDGDSQPGGNQIEGCFPLAGGRMLFREHGGTFSVFDVKQNHFLKMDVREKQRLYEQVRQRHADSGTLAPFRDILEHGGNYINDNLGNTVVIDQTGHIWFIDRHTSETFEMDVFDRKLFPLVNSHKYKVMTSEEQQLVWVSTNGCGITVYDRRTREVHHIRQSSGLISTDCIVDICLDRNGNLWAADEFHGVVCLSTNHNTAQSILLMPDSRDLRSNQVYIMRPVSDTTLLVANTKGDVWEADMQLRLHRVMQATDVHAACSDRQGRLWLGSRRQGFRSPDGAWHPHSDDEGSPSSSNITALLCDRDGRIWMGCEDARLGLLAAQADGSYKVRHLLPDCLSPKVLTEGSDGTVWVGARTGLFSFRPSQLVDNGDSYVQHLTQQDTKRCDVNCVYEDRRHRLWVGTGGNGVYWSDDRGKTFRRLTMAEGLISNEIQSIVSPDDSTLWIATKRGITCYQPDKGSFRYIYNENNLLQNYYADNSVCLLGNGRIAYGTNEGIVVYDAADYHPSTVKRTSLTVTDLLINGISVSLMGSESPLDTSPDDAGCVELAHHQNAVTVRFSTFRFNKAAGTRYTYFMEGYDQRWSEVSDYSFATYKNLQPGHYTLHVKAFENESDASAERQFTIIVRHPWWQTWWAYLVYLLIAAASAWLVYRQLRTVYELRRRISIEQQLTEYKLQFFTNISHEFRTPLTIIRGAMERMTRVKDLPADLRQPVSTMQKGTNRMLRLVNQLLEFRKMQNRKLRLALEETDVVAFVKDICQDFMVIADNKQISFNILSSVKSFPMFIDRQHVDKIVYNLLSNAFKYTPTKGTVTVRIRAEQTTATQQPSPASTLSISVEDTGVGIPKEKQPELFQRFMQSTFSNDSIGIGLHLTKALVEVHHGSIGYAENQPQGSVFTVSLPTDKSVYQPEDFLQPSELEAESGSSSPYDDYRELMPEPMNDRRVLVVEDDSDVADFLRQTLGRFFSVDVSMDGNDALDKLCTAKEGEDFDLVVSDVMMPMMDGLELTRRIRSNARTLAIPIVLLTALASEDQRVKGIGQGADAYLHKPFEARLLVTTCRQLMEQRDKLKVAYADLPSPKNATPPEIIVEERDKHLLDVLNIWLADHIANPNLSVDDVADAMGYRRSIFFRKVKSLTGQTPADYIRTMRMNRAAEMLREETVTVAEVAYQVGISDPHYFSRVFRQQFGVSPKQYQKGK